MDFIETIDVASPLRVLIRNHQDLLGDRMAFTPLVRDLKRTYPQWQIYVSVGDSGVWLNNPHVAGVITPGLPEPAKIDLAVNVGPFRATQGSKANGIHFMRAFTYGWIRATAIPVALGPLRADLHLSAEEREYRPIAGPYWLFNPDTNNMGAKRWEPARWRELIRSCPEIRFVQVGLAQDAVEDYGDEPNVTSLVGQTSTRQLFALAAASSGCISLISSLMHVAAAFGRPCVVLAGGREPATFEQYPNHYYISRVGMLDCCRDLACWKNSIGACRDPVETQTGPPEARRPMKIARCMTMIEVADVRRGLELYRAEDVVRRASCVERPTQPALRNPHDALRVTGHDPRLLRIVTNGKCYGGAERSVAQIALMFREKGWQVEVATRQPMCPPMRSALADVAVETDRITGPADCLLWYASDQVFDIDKPEFDPLGQATVMAGRKVMALTYKLGKVPTTGWCQGWDAYLFLSSAMAGQFKSRASAMARTTVLAPAVALAPFLAVQPNYAAPTRVVRHSSQGDNKWCPETQSLVHACPDAKFHFMPAPSWLLKTPNCTVHPFATVTVPEFLRMGSLFLYLLPEGYTDQGPRVVVEAMAAGLPVICESRDGCADRVTAETGWFVRDHEEAAERIRGLTPELLAAKGRAARARAAGQFDPWRWYEAISGESPPGPGAP